VNLKTQCVIYDCDGVLFDSLEANRKLYNDICASVGRSPLTDEEMRYAHSSTVSEALRFIFRDDPAHEKRAREVQQGIDFRDYVPFLKMEPHLFEVLDGLKERGILRAISTNRTTSMKHIMERFGLWPYFETVVTALDVVNPKPHPEPVEKILQTLQVKKEGTFLVGDSEIDKRAARSSGVRFVAYKNREIAEDLFINDHLALLTLVADQSS
jgi:phosphoglycolate phosphatase